MQDNVTIMCHYIIFGMCMSFNSYFFYFLNLRMGTQTVHLTEELELDVELLQDYIRNNTLQLF